MTNVLATGIFPEQSEVVESPVDGWMGGQTDNPMIVRSIEK